MAASTSLQECCRKTIDQCGLARARGTYQQHAPVIGQHDVDQPLWISVQLWNPEMWSVASHILMMAQNIKQLLLGEINDFRTFSMPVDSASASSVQPLH
jgi:hypothetical protein